jgi:alpha-mannosidase
MLNWNGTKYREFRMALPVKVNAGQVTYEVPMGVVEVGKGEIPTTGGVAYKNAPYGSLDYYEQCSKIRPREVQNFINVSDNGIGVTLSSSVLTFDYQDPTTNPVDYPVISPILLASRKSCHGEGNWYLQPGDHHFSFSISSHPPGWQNGYRFGIQANHPLLVLKGGVPGATAILPEEKSFFEVSSGNVLISTIKKAEDDNDMVLRCYEMEGKDTPLVLRSFVPMVSGEWTNIIEEEGRPLAVKGTSISLPVGHNAIETVKLRPAFK